MLCFDVYNLCQIHTYAIYFNMFSPEIFDHFIWAIKKNPYFKIAETKNINALVLTNYLHFEWLLKHTYNCRR